MRLFIYSLEPHFLESILYFLEMEIQGTQRLQLTFLEVPATSGSRFKLLNKIGVIAAGMFDFPRFLSHCAEPGHRLVRGRVPF